VKPGLRMALWGLVATVIGTWPLASPGEALVQRNVDGYGSAWLVWRSAAEGLGLGHLEWIDTLLFGLVAPLLAPLGIVTAYHLVTFFGVLLAVLVTEQVAHHLFTVPRPASLAAGVAFGLSPLAGTAIAEGHGGMLLGAGLPLLLGALEWDPAGRRLRWALAVTAAGTICALQSGYFAVLAALVVLVYGGLRRRPLWLLALVAAAPAYYYVAFALGGLGLAEVTEATGRVSGLVATVATADNLAGIPPGFDQGFYHVRYPLLWTLLAFGLVVPLLRRERSDLPLLVCGVVAALLALGTRAQVTAFHGDFESMRTGAPWGWIRHWIPPLSLFRFPSRFLWIWYLCVGVAAARSLAWLLPRRTMTLVALVFVEAMVLGMRPLEPRQTLAAVPSAYEVLQPEDVVLDLWPWFPDSLALQLLNISCYYQTGHAAQLPYECLTIKTSDSPFRGQIDGLLPAILEDTPPRANAILAGGKVTHVAVHVDAFSPSGRARLRERLGTWWGRPIASSRDGGETVEIYRVRKGRRSPVTPLQPTAGSEPLERGCPAHAMCRNGASMVLPSPDPVPLWVLPSLAGVLGLGFLLLGGWRRPEREGAEELVDRGLPAE